MITPDEKWEIISEFPNYMISSESRVLNKTTLRILSVHRHKHGHRVVRLWRDGKTKLCKIYRLKAIAFIDNPLNKREVNHKFGDRMDEDLGGLEWSTPKENMRHAIDNGLCGGQFKSGFSHQFAKLTKEDVLKIRSLREEGIKYKDIASMFSITIDHACRIYKRKIYSNV